jgi:hypothetical protein
MKIFLVLSALALAALTYDLYRIRGGVHLFYPVAKQMEYKMIMTPTGYWEWRWE